MKRTIILSLMFSTFVASTWAKDTTPEFKVYLKTMKPALEKAFKNKDIAYFDKWMTADCTYVSGKLVESRVATVNAMKQLFGMAKFVSCTDILVSAQANDNQGIAVVKQVMTTVLKPTPKDRVAHKMVSDSQIRLTLVRTGKTWKLKKLEDIVPPKMTIDGKPMKM